MLTEEILKDALHYGKAFTKLGKTAQYIPQLKEVNKYYLGVCAMDLDGKVLEAGDYESSVYHSEYFLSWCP